ncbi:MAG: hypothetical protein IPN69_14535 [Acidobacteria bacterium]|nr:hypothetical protein [Acidobacteriota bacterium]
MRLGNGKWESTAFNSRLQPTRIGLGGSASDQSLLKLDYTYGTVVNGQLDTTKNNGNIQSQTITVPTVGSSNGFTAVQTYNYDSLNRIDDATEMVTPAGSSTATQSWKQDYTFDRYGNRNFVEANTTTIPRNCLDNQSPPNQVICDVDRKMMNPSVNAANNRLSASDGYQFDAAGNTTRDAQLRKFTYDAENKQTKVESVNSSGTVTGTIGEYVYDGGGRRVKKIAYANNQPTETTVFIYDASSRLVAEYSTNLNPKPQVAYLTNDHLGSPRINTNENGAVIPRHDYRPYGEEITERTHAEYVVDTIRKQFTSYERDDEVDLDFAQARYYYSKIGRFTTVDPLMASADIIDPQTFNRFSYSGNSPLIYTDPTGEQYGINDAGRIEWFNGALGKGFRPYDALVAQITGTNQLVVLSATGGVPTPVANAGEALRLLIGSGAAAAALEASAIALGVTAVAAAGLAAAYVCYQNQASCGGSAVNQTGAPGIPMRDLINMQRYFYGKDAVPSPFDYFDAQGNIQSQYMMNGNTSESDSNSSANTQGDAATPDPDDNKPQSSVEDNTTGSSIPNTRTNVAKSDFVKNLQANGYSTSTSKDGFVLILTKGNRRYVVRDKSNQGSPTADFYKNGKLVRKIRITP